ncbi:hypothetical protein EJ06DRAFT_560547 [Trichodelitschia bisporula]|uniref:Uncharacterized protein n=1 Tax=Trichodelitschia bisporula TaxID=703511 RepID=A0A6G1HIE0_9PEZI|nr:hypothetical protein EJ06DRAFT_560547 [Trichodelitschia bisporula]
MFKVMHADWTNRDPDDDLGNLHNALRLGFRQCSLVGCPNHCDNLGLREDPKVVGFNVLFVVDDAGQEVAALIRRLDKEGRIKDVEKVHSIIVKAFQAVSVYLNLAALQGNVWILDACQLLLARKTGIITALPAHREVEIHD